MLITNENTGPFPHTFTNIAEWKVNLDIMNVAVYDSDAGTLTAKFDLEPKHVGKQVRQGQHVSTFYNGILGIPLQGKIYRTIDIIFLMAHHKLPPHGAMYFKDGDQTNLKWDNIWLDWEKCTNSDDRDYWEKQVDERYAKT